MPLLFFEGVTGGGGGRAYALMCVSKTRASWVFFSVSNCMKFVR